jgi:hypothetical protein
MPGGARFSLPVQTDSEVHPASYTAGTRSLPGIKRPGCGVDRPPPSSAEVKESVELYLYSSSGPLWPVLRVNFTFRGMVPLIFIYEMEASGQLHAPAAVHLGRNPGTL